MDPDQTTPPYALEAAAVVAAMGSDEASGLGAAEAADRLAQHGPNEIAREEPPSVWAIAAQQLRDPMNIMLIAVTIVSVAIGQVSTGVIVALLILLNVVLGSRQELKAQASVAALAQLPLMVVRGANSDILSAATLARMQARHPRLEALSVRGEGHTPLLKDAPTITAIADFLARTDGEGYAGEQVAAA